MANVKIPYAMVPAVAITARRSNMASSIARGLPRLNKQHAKGDGVFYIACYGPSLKDTYEQLRDKHPLISMSGATKWLAERGIIPDYAIEMDPRPVQVELSLPPVKGVTYLIASCVHPNYFDAVQAAGNPIVLWHPQQSNYQEDLEWLKNYDHEDPLLISAGSTVGLASIQIGGLLGYSRFEIHGMDGSFSSDGHRHAGAHCGKEQPDDTVWDAGGKSYRTSKIMANAVAESVNVAKNFPIITIWHGDGLTQALIREADLINAACADQAEKVERLRGLTPRVIDAPVSVNSGTDPTLAKISVWDGLLSMLEPSDLPDLIGHIRACEPRRARAHFNTGSIPFESAAYLRAIARFFRPTRIVEIGTFIGTSAMALLLPDDQSAIWTCDKSNDCLTAGPLVAKFLPDGVTDGTNSARIYAYPFTTSTSMLRQVHGPVDMFFFDGRIQSDDIPEIVRLSTPQTVYVVDDYYGEKEKGVVNARILLETFKDYTLMTPTRNSVSTIAFLAPRSSVTTHHKS